ncbi:hypothetical protein BY996DRAFT_6410691 [Phakopsora pachyrhizi]|nr:hypothetical protein BY996DRAFT_6410691 [Phakopsora pachyrhizi]
MASTLMPQPAELIQNEESHLKPYLSSASNLSQVNLEPRASLGLPVRSHLKSTSTSANDSEYQKNSSHGSECSKLPLVISCVKCRQTSIWFSAVSESNGPGKPIESPATDYFDEPSSFTVGYEDVSASSIKPPEDSANSQQCNILPALGSECPASGYPLLNWKGGQVSALCSSCHHEVNAGSALKFALPDSLNIAIPPLIDAIMLTIEFQSASTERFPHRALQSSSNAGNSTSSSFSIFVSPASKKLFPGPLPPQTENDERTQAYPQLDHSDNSSSSSVELSTSETQSSGKAVGDQKVYIRFEDPNSISSHDEPASLKTALEGVSVVSSPKSQIQTSLPISSILRKASIARSIPRPNATLSSENLPPAPVALQASRSRNRLRDPSLVGISESDESGEDVKRIKSIPGKRSRSDIRAGEAYTKSEDCSPNRKESSRGENLRMLLRQAKIPPVGSQDIELSRRRILSPSEVWEAAMMPTSQDHLRNANLSNWQSYHSLDLCTEFHPLQYRSKISPSSLSSAEAPAVPRSKTSQTLINSDSRTPSNFSPSSDEHSPPRVASPASLRSEKRPSLDVAKPGILGRRPSLARQGKVAEFSPTSNNCPHYDSKRDCLQQEVLSFSSGDAIRRTGSSQRPVRPAGISGNLLSRFAQHCNVGGSNDVGSKSLKRRPNTATGGAASSGAPIPSPKPSNGFPTPVSTKLGISPIKIPSLNSSPSPKSTEFSINTKIPFFVDRPATATGVSQQPIGFSIRSNPVFIRPLTAQSPTRPISTFSTVDHRPVTGLKTSIFGLRHNEELNSCASKTRNFLEDCGPKLSSKRSESVLRNHRFANANKEAVASSLSKSVPASPNNERLNESRSTNVMASTENLVSKSCARLRNESSFSSLPPEDFYSKSRNLTLSVIPRPSSETFRPGQKITLFVRLGSKIKAKKYSSISLMLMGAVHGEAEGIGSAHHPFLRINYEIYPTPAEGVKVLCSQNSIESGEWKIELNIPQFANCRCLPGPLPIPSSGPHQTGEVSYSFHLTADKKQLLPSSESIIFKFHLATLAEARFQVTTQPIVQKFNKGRIDFAGGYLGSIEEYSICHQVYYQSADRLRIGYQIEIVLSKHSFLPTQVAEDFCKSIKVDLRNLYGELSQQQKNPSTTKGPGLIQFHDQRSKLLIRSAEDGDDSKTKWIIKGYLEIKNVIKQMQSLRASLEFGSTPISPSTSHGTGGSGSLSGGFGKIGRSKTSAGGQSMQQVNSTSSSLSGFGTNSMNGVSLSTAGASGTSSSLQSECDRLTRSNNSQIFLVATWDHHNHQLGILSKSIEMTSLIGPDLISKCGLRKLGEVMMKRVIIEEKMKRVQEINDKNRTNE